MRFCEVSAVEMMLGINKGLIIWKAYIISWDFVKWVQERSFMKIIFMKSLLWRLAIIDDAVQSKDIEKTQNIHFLLLSKRCHFSGKSLTL